MTRDRRQRSSSSLVSMTCSFILLALVTTLLSSNKVEAAISCQPWIGQPEACAAYIQSGSLVYVPDNTTQVDLLMSALPALGGLTDLAAVPRCQLAYLEYTCLTTFPLCNNGSRIGTAYDYTELRPTCRSACDPVVRFCSATLNALGRANEIPDCQAVYPDSSVYAEKAVYPTSSWRWNITTPDTVVACHDVEAPPVQCPPHYSYVDDLDVPSPCLPSCPSEIYTDTEYTAQYAVLTTGGGLSVIAGAFVLPPYLLRPERWRWPQQMNIWIIMCNWLIASTHVIPLILNGNDWEGVVCEDDTTPSDIHNPLCGIQGLWLSYFAWAGFMWWFGVCMNLLLTVQRVELDTRVQCILWHFCSWGIALLPIIIAASNDEIGGSGVECGYTGSNEGWIMQSVFWIPILLLWLVGGLALVFVIVELLRLEGIKGILSQLRLLLFTVSSLWPVIYGAAFFYSIRAQIDDISYDLGRWFVCVATSPDEDVCDKYRNPPNYGASMVGTINTGWMQLLWILIFGISPAIWNWWRHLIVNIVKCRWKSLPQWWDKMDSSSSSSSIGGPTVFNRGAQRGVRQNRVGRKPIKPVQGTHRPSLDRA